MYGPSKGGKTRLVGTAAELPEIERIFWFDTENGVKTLMTMGLSEAAMKKITVFKIRDTREEPFACETLLKAFATKKSDGVSICNMHGRVDCASCKAEKLGFTPFNLKNCTHNDLVVIDSGSQLGDSALNVAMLGKDVSAKPGWDEFGEQGRYLGDILSVIQQATYTNFIVITHEIEVKDNNDNDKEKILPLMGTKNFCLKCPKYFGTVIYVHKKMNKHVAGSSSTYRGDLVTGSRLNIAIENEKELDMRAILIKGGILKEGITAEQALDKEVDRLAVVAAAVKTDTPKPMTALEKLKANKAAQAAK